MARKSLVLGIDGAPGRSVGILADDTGVLQARREGAGTNLNGLAYDNVARAFYILIARCCEDARCKPQDLAAVVIGMSGLDRDEDRAHLREHVNSLFSKAGSGSLPLSFESDARIALESAFDGGVGVVVMAGSGSLVIGKTPRGQVVSVGGWGNIIGDEGSGYFIGREALVAITRESEKRGTAGRLREVLSERFHF